MPTPWLARLARQRARNERIDVLCNLGLIDTARNGHEQHGHILLVDPHIAVLKLQASPKTVLALQASSKKDCRTEFQEWVTQFTVFCEQWGIDLETYKAIGSDSATDKTERA